MNKTVAMDKKLYDEIFAAILYLYCRNQYESGLSNPNIMAFLMDNCKYGDIRVIKNILDELTALDKEKNDEINPNEH